MAFLSRVLIAVLGFEFLIQSVFTQSQFPPIAVWERGQLSASPFPDGPNRFCNFTNGGFTAFQRTGDTSVWTAEVTNLWAASQHGGSVIANGQLCPEDGSCIFTFQEDGNFVSSFEGVELWSTGTEGRGMWFVCSEVAPYLWIVDGAGTVIWSTNSP